MTQWLARALDLIAADEPSVLVTICATMGSSPRDAGAKMLLWRGGQVGTIGGGNLEFLANDQARKMLEHPDCAYRIQDYPLGPLLAQCCGGHVRLLLERIDAQSAPWLNAARTAEDSNQPFSLVTEVGEGAVKKRIVGVGDHVPGSAGIPGGPFLANVWSRESAGRDASGPRVFDSRGGRVVGAKPVHDEKLVIVEDFSRALHDLVMFGAGHVGQAVARIAATLPFRVAWFDSREAMIGVGRDGELRVQLAEDPVATIDTAPVGAFYLVFTHSHDLDYKLVRAILWRQDFHYCGLIGSATKRARFETRLTRDSLTQLDIARLTCPIGAIGLTGKAPEILAVAIAAELLLAIQSGSGDLVRDREHSALGGS